MAPGPEDNRDRPLENNPESDVIENEELPNVVINVGESDSDEDFDEADNMGYSLIPQEPVDVIDSDMLSDSENDSPHEHAEQVSEQNMSAELPSGLPTGIDYESLGMPKPTYLEAPDIPKPDKKSLLWNQPRQIGATHSDLDSDKIKSAMAGFLLPTENVPNWAKTLSDTQWKEHVEKIRSPITPKSSEEHMEEDLS